MGMVIFSLGLPDVDGAVEVKATNMGEPVDPIHCSQSR